MGYLALRGEVAEEVEDEDSWSWEVCCLQRSPVSRRTRGGGFVRPLVEASA